MSFFSERQRLLGIRRNLERRATIFQLTRSFFAERGFIEVDTPVRVPYVAPEQHISPFESEGWFLSTSPELHMKRLLAAGYDKVFQISRCFRKGEIGRQHNPEFTMLEWYRAGAGHLDMIADTQDLVIAIASAQGTGMTLRTLGRTVDLAPPWRRITVQEAFLRAAGWDPITDFDPLLFDEDLVAKVIPSLDPCSPVVLDGYPAALASLARLSRDDRRVAERAEVFIAGMELANAYSELNDPIEQRIRFEESLARITNAGGKGRMPTRFLDVLEHLPASGGIALGMDRLVMLFCDVDSIRDVTAFPHDEI